MRPVALGPSVCRRISETDTATFLDLVKLAQPSSIGPLSTAGNAAPGDSREAATLRGQGVEAPPQRRHRNIYRPCRLTSSSKICGPLQPGSSREVDRGCQTFMRVPSTYEV